MFMCKTYRSYSEPDNFRSKMQPVYILSQKKARSQATGRLVTTAGYKSMAAFYKDYLKP